MDIRLPGISGFDVTEIIKKNKKLKEIPVIAFTASMVHYKNDNIDKLFDGYLQKPVFKKDIDNILHKFLSFSYNTEITPVKSTEDENQELAQVNEKILPSVISELEEIHLINWENIKDNLIIYEIEDFKNKLSEMAFQYSCRAITQYCNELNLGLQTFDIELIEKKLQDFPALIIRLKSVIN
jgi:CheY-like chemotaxis protein